MYLRRCRNAGRKKTTRFQIIFGRKYPDFRCGAVAASLPASPAQPELSRPLLIRSFTSSIPTSLIAEVLYGPYFAGVSIKPSLQAVTSSLRKFATQNLKERAWLFIK
ncbi:hypothetical protein [Undibacterium sp.]|jgi:hypothetical protein|uniref:hypothetical protein n=1 Tax=Undibacterium sp. TaxID=1914977 RepID=UPI002C27C3D4|nr:hypothetical protein [Undibacterium sp.]HTD06883.1 hypothetical protein [Undibacterium sp.]